jgi:hypothetical protein
MYLTTHNGLTTQIDAEDLHLLKCARKQWWIPYALNKRSKVTNRAPNFYVSVYTIHNRHIQQLFLHKLVAEQMLGRPLLKGEVVDHISGQTLDNRRCNLRVVSVRTNATNTQRHRNGHLAGTTYDKKVKKWKAQIIVDGNNKYLGLFTTKEEAHQAYLQAVDNL